MFKIISFKHKQPKPPIPHCLHITDEVDILKRKLVIGVGVGSGRGFYEGLARCGVSNFLFMYHEDEHSRYSNMLDMVADRNFVQVRMSPFVGEHLGLHVFDQTITSDYGFFDDTVWIPQVPNNEANGFKTCPLCGGTGDLLALKGSIVDTREV